MSKPILTATTPFGAFTRQTDRPFTHLVVFVPAGKDQGLQCSWHLTKKAAHQNSIRLAHMDSGNEPGSYAVCAIEQELVQDPEPLNPEFDTTDTLTDSPEFAAAMVEVQAEPAHVEGVLTHDEALYLVNTGYTVRQVGKKYTHQLKLDKNDSHLARTYCGVPIKGASQNWLKTSDELSCPTCVATQAKMRKQAAKTTNLVAA
jgi:hypothetical protein